MSNDSELVARVEKLRLRLLRHRDYNKQLGAEIQETLEAVSLTQKELDERKNQGIMRAWDVPLLAKFVRTKNTDVYIRVVPSSFLMNSKLIQENMNKDKVLVVDTYTGECFFILGGEYVTLV